IVKKGGIFLGELLWKAWGLQGDFQHYLHSRLSLLLSEIKIDNPDARIRAFKSLYWAPRWTSINFAPFLSRRPAEFPYYRDEICKFICTVPENLLRKRQIQI